jgi:hypothetical protein
LGLQLSLQRQLRCHLLLLPGPTTRPRLPTNFAALGVCTIASFRAFVALASRPLLPTNLHVNFPIVILIFVPLLLPCTARLARPWLLLLRIWLVHLLLRWLLLQQWRWRLRCCEMPLLLCLPHQLSVLLLLQQSLMG